MKEGTVPDQLVIVLTAQALLTERDLTSYGIVLLSLGGICVVGDILILIKCRERITCSVLLSY